MTIHPCHVKSNIQWVFPVVDDVVDDDDVTMSSNSLAFSATATPEDQQVLTKICRKVPGKIMGPDLFWKGMMGK